MNGSPEIEEVFLKPGELYFGGGRVRVRTVLGSCVSVTLWHPGRRVGGMCHYMLPSRAAGTQAPDARYGNEALALLLAEIRRARTGPAEYVVKLFGGGSMYPPQAAGRPCGHGGCDARSLAVCSDVACKNVLAGRALLRHHGFRLEAEHVGGIGHRNIRLDLWSGEVWLRHGGPLPAACREPV